jgi:hypothetical protein
MADLSDLQKKPPAPSVRRREPSRSPYLLAAETARHQLNRLRELNDLPRLAEQIEKSREAVHRSMTNLRRVSAETSRTAL